MAGSKPAVLPLDDPRSENLFDSGRLGASVRAVLGRRLSAQVASLGAATLTQRLFVINVLAVALAHFAFFHELVPGTIASSAPLFDFRLAVVLAFFAIVSRVSRHFAISR